MNVKYKGGFILRKGDRIAGEPSAATIVPSGPIGMRQLFDEQSCTYSYLMWDKETEDAIIVDPVDVQCDRELLVATTLNVVFAVNTHCHDDHISGTQQMKKKVKGLKSVISKASKAEADEHIGHLDEIHFGNRYITALATPGHTEGCLSFLTDDKKAVLTGDALLISSCGRTDLQGGSATTLYDSVHEQLFVLADDCIVFPAHDYNERTHSTIGEEKEHNPRFGKGINKDEFVKTMSELKLPHPKLMDQAIPANLEDGADPFFVRSLRTKLKDSWGIYA